MATIYLIHLLTFEIPITNVHADTNTGTDCNIPIVQYMYIELYENEPNDAEDARYCRTLLNEQLL